MKEFVEKLIERLEEQSVEITFPLYPDDSTSFVPITEAISIVNQLAEEYKSKLIADIKFVIEASEKLNSVDMSGFIEKLIKRLEELKTDTINET